MPAIPIHNSELIMECLMTWQPGSGKWAPTLHRFPRPILDHQDGPAILIGGLLLAGMTKTTLLIDNQMYLVDTFIIHNVMSRPIGLAAEDTQVEPVEIMRLNRHPKEPEHKFVLTCASTLMSVYFGLVAGDLGRFGRDERVPACGTNGRAPTCADPGPNAMVSCPDCGGMLFPSISDHPWPVYRYNDMRIIYRI
jgi:hypothetical protein